MISREEKNNKLQNEIIDEEKRGKRKKRWFLFFKIFITILIIFLSLFLYVRFVSTKGLVVREYKVESKDLPNSFHGFKIVHFTDLHYGSTIMKKDLKKIVDKINYLNPDIVVFTGDLIDKDFNLTTSDIKDITKELTRIDPLIAKYAVYGNHDYVKDVYSTIMNSSNFTILRNSSEFIYKDSNDPILITGLDDSIKGNIDINSAFNYFNDPTNNQNIYTISLLHEPDIIDQVLSNYKTNLALAGHSHNGQIRLPFMNPLFKVRDAKKYNDEEYNINNTKLFISGGLGTSNYKLRFFNRPSINFYRLVKTK